MAVKKRIKRRAKPEAAVAVEEKPRKIRRRAKKSKPFVAQCGYCEQERVIISHEEDPLTVSPGHSDFLMRPVCRQCYPATLRRDVCVGEIYSRLGVVLTRKGKSGPETGRTLYQLWRKFYLELDHGAVLKYAKRLGVDVGWDPSDFA